MQALMRLVQNSRKSEFWSGAGPLPRPATHRVLSLGGRPLRRKCPPDIFLHPGRERAGTGLSETQFRIKH